ncbi:MAG: FecR domain-containing protein [Taibaiella sp.]|nr:FecR domain-containing protein [Taibaiella sp.]
MNNNKENSIDDVLVKYLLGEATPAETDEVMDWVNASDANRKYFDQFKLIWNESKKLEGKTTIGTEEAWGRFMQRVEREEQGAESRVRNEPKGRTIQLHGLSWMKAAAILVMLVGSGWLIYTFTGGAGGGQMLAQSFDRVQSYTLPDGSMVTLNKNSELSYPAHFDGNSRSVVLKGEAFFNITPDKSKPFIIDAGNSSVTVVGTTFNVKSREEVTEVIVETGIVEVMKKQNAVRLQPGQKATVTKDNDAPVTENITDELYNYYRTNEFVCNATPLYKMVATLNEAYNTDIVIASDRLKTLPLSVTFHNESLENILKVIGETFKTYLIVEKSGNRIILKER